MNTQDVVVFDVRTPEEHTKFWVLPRVDLYMNMYDNDFFEQLWKLDKTNKYLIYCWHASRTGFLLNYMSNSGFEYIKDLEWGIDAWVEAWYELVNKET
jgi:rhodanese-related sulfurtransferase